ncbi:DUF262 domain-containing protein [Nocardioides terrigena]|uniref:DUF262 domain-containing protein n=1 Tax=Nocardioides terrigena TaxID=424797 RepID=UPI0018FFE835|nr:DUF262 domain-containing protein [Nocardioides terrigena]
MSHDRVIVDRFQRAQEALILQHNDLGLSTLAQMVGSGTIDVAPDFQRRDRWAAKKQSLLIESLLLNLPVPPVYLSEDLNGTFSVIDGRQRLTAISRFMNNELVLQGLAEFPELNGTRYEAMPQMLKTSLAMRPLRSVTLMKQTDPELKYTVFHRLNSAGEVLNPQEIRNVIFRGPLNDLIHELAESEFLRHQLKIRNEQASAFRKMQDLEYVLRFLTLTGSWERFSGDLSRSMDVFMEENQYADADQLHSYSLAFRRAIDAAAGILGEFAFNRPEGNGWRSQALAGLYDAQMIAFHELARVELQTLASKPDRAIMAVRDLFENREFENAVRVGTNTPSRIRYRTGAMIEAFSRAANA